MQSWVLWTPERFGSAHVQMVALIIIISIYICDRLSFILLETFITSARGLQTCRFLDKPTLKARLPISDYHPLSPCLPVSLSACLPLSLWV